MKLRVKLALAIVFLLSLVFGLGGSLLVSVSFSSTLENERQSALRSYMATQNALLLANSISQQSDYNDIVDTISQLNGQSQALWSGVRLSNGSQLLFISGTIPTTPEIPVENGFCSVSMFSDQAEKYIIVSGLIRVNNDYLRLDISSDVTTAYIMRRTQLGIYHWLLLAVVALGAAGSWIIASVLTGPIMRLSKTSRSIADGDLDARANIASGDEVEALANDFNAMASRLQENINELQDSMRRQEEFMGSFAHELKTPMTSIIGYSDLLRSRSLDDEERQEAANYIFSESRRLESLSIKLLDLLVLKRQDMELSEASPSAIISGIIRNMKSVLAKQDIVIKYRCESGSCLLEADLVKSLLINLIDNSRKGMDGPGIIYILSTMTDTGCTIQVVDNGRGIPEKELDRITEAFYRVDKSRSRAQGGAGLGLALCREIALLHNGDIRIKSILGKGTSVMVELNGGRI